LESNKIDRIDDETFLSFTQLEDLYVPVDIFFIFLTNTTMSELSKMSIIIHLQKRGEKRIRTITHQRPGETIAPKNV